jgi:hypothetical protein
MKILLASFAALVLVSACREKRANDTAAGYRSAADTVVTKRQVEDTAVVRHDTIIRSDTVKKRGGRTGKADTVRKE